MSQNNLLKSYEQIFSILKTNNSEVPDIFYYMYQVLFYNLVYSLNKTA